MKWLPILLLTTLPLHAALRLPAVISDHALLQAEKPIAIWGWAAPGVQAKVAFTTLDGASSTTFTATADATGKWSGRLNGLKSGTAGELKITTNTGEQKTIHDVLVGEVWLASGQSNMEYTIAGGSRVDPTNPEEVATVAHNIQIAKTEAEQAQPPIRYFGVTSKGADEPADDVRGKWVLADSKNVESFSAVAWNFAIALQGKLNAPVGLIVASAGGTPVEAWMSKETLAATSVGPTVLERHKNALAAVTPEMIAKFEAAMKNWNAANPTPELQFRNAATRPPPVYTPTNNRTPIRLYNGLIHGLEPYGLRGVIWFQADGNIKHPWEYSELFQALIKGWRADWHEELPFYFVEMNNMSQEKQTKPVQPYALCLLREQQHGGLQLPGVGMVASIDLGIRNPHFPDKKPVGERLAGLALCHCYGQSNQVNSPIYQGFAVEGNKIRLRFNDADGLRVRGGGDLKGFAIRGATGDWLWADGRIQGREIVVWNDEIPSPVAVRYAWAANPIISVENGAGLPLYPFRTDTESKK